MRALLLFLTLIAAPAQAQNACGPLKDMDARLSEKYGERIVWTGQSVITKQVYLLYLDPDDGSWTVLTMTLRGRVCMVDGGNGGSMAKPQEPDKVVE